MSDDLHAELTTQLRAEVGAVAAALDALLGSIDQRALDRVYAQAPMWAAQMLDNNDDRIAAQTVIDVMNVIGSDTEQPTEWWKTPLGQVVARSVGHPTARVVSYPMAGAMLGCSKQAVHKRVRTGTLTAGPDGGVTAESVRDLIRRNAVGPSVTPRPAH